MRDPHFFCYPACHYVYLIFIGACNKKRDVLAVILYTSLFKNAGPGSVAPDDNNIQIVLNTLCPLFIFFNHNNVVSVSRKIFSHSVTDFSDPNQNDFQSYSAFRSIRNRCVATANIL